MEFSRSAVLRRWYFVSVGLLFVLLLTLRLTALDTVAQTSDIRLSLADIADNLMAASITSLVVGVAYVYLYPANNHAAQEVVRSIDIAQTILDECKAAREWSVRSRGANYFTTVTLSDLIESALASGRAIRVRVQTIDPENEVLLKAYASSMSDIKARVGTWSVERARREVLASLLRAAMKIRSAPRIDVQFGLSPASWVMSLDLSDRMALVTCQNKGEDALIFRHGAPFFFKGYADDFEAGWLACRHVRPELVRSIPADPEKLGVEDLRALSDFYTSLGLSEPSAEELQEIVRTVSRDHDYA